jgi:predicted NAD/FAD-dependent oxidoreductase
MSTRRVDADGTTWWFDHGAQYLTARDPRFARRIEEWANAGVVARWPDAGNDAWVGMPAMNAPLRAMAHRLDVTFATTISALMRDGVHWRLEGAGTPSLQYDMAVVAVPAEQAAPLLAPHDTAMAARAAATRSAPCWTVMAGFATRVPCDANILRDAGAISWAARNGAKPARDAGECWVIQAAPDWSSAHLEDEPSSVTLMLLGEFADAIGGSLPNPIVATAHRWRFARSGAAGDGSLWNPTQRLGCCGDWLLGPRVECAWLSGTMLADAILETPGHG